MKTSLVIPAHDKAQRLRFTLAAVQGLQKLNEVELLLVADNPTPAVREVLTEQTLGRVIESPGLGRAGARNLGAAASSSDLLVFIDDDILFESDFIAQHHQAQRKSPGLVHGRLREMIGLSKTDDPAEGGPGCPPIDATKLYCGQWKADRIRLVANALSQAIEHTDAVHWPWLVAGANLSLPRDCWQRVGGFDQSYGTRWGMEDIDFAYRLFKAGTPVSFAVDACGYHMSHAAQSDRWEGHNVNLARFLELTNCPEAQALDELLASKGSIHRYRQRVDQIRQLESVPLECP